MSDAHKESTHGRIEDELVQISKDADLIEDPARQRMDELERLLEQSSEESFPVDKLDRLLTELDATGQEPDAAAFDAEEGLKRFHARQAQAAGGDEPSAATSFGSSSSHRPKRTTLKTVLIAAALAVLVLASSAQAFRVNFFDLIAQWTSELFGFDAASSQSAEYTRNPLARNEERTYSSVQEMLDDFGVTAPLFPTWVPERFGEPSVYARNTSMGLRMFADFDEGEEELHVRAYAIDPKNQRDTEINAGGVDSTRINGMDYYFMSDESAEKTVWKNGSFECQVYGNVTEEELEQIVSSINKGR